VHIAIVYIAFCMPSAVLYWLLADPNDGEETCVPRNKALPSKQKQCSCATLRGGQMENYSYLPLTKMLDPPSVVLCCAEYT
jgi:hypothetical protein